MVAHPKSYFELEVSGVSESLFVGKFSELVYLLPITLMVFRRNNGHLTELRLLVLQTCRPVDKYCKPFLETTTKKIYLLYIYM